MTMTARAAFATHSASVNVPFCDKMLISQLIITDNSTSLVGRAPLFRIGLCSAEEGSSDDSMLNVRGAFLGCPKLLLQVVSLRI